MANAVTNRSSEFWNRIYFIFHLKWIIWCVWAWNYWYATPKSQSSGSSTSAPPADAVKSGRNKRKTRKIVHIGDDVALGVGDWATLLVPTGVLHYLDIQQPLLISTWVSAIEGRFGATSDDWTPGGVHFESLFNPQRAVDSTAAHHLDADVVIITVGTNDTCAPSASATNIMNAVRALQQRLFNKHAVIIVNVPPIPPPVLNRPDDSKVKQRVLARNDAIRAAVIKEEFDERVLRLQSEQVGEDSACHEQPHKSFGDLAGAAHGLLRAGADMHRMFASQEDAFCLRSLHLNPRAYKEVARSLSETVRLAQKTVEADDLKKMMSGGGRLTR